MWIESDAALATDPRVMALADALGLSDAAAIGHLHLVWWWAAAHTDGGATGPQLARAARYAGPGFAEALERAGFAAWDDLGACYRLADWARINRPQAQREHAAERQRRKRAAKPQPAEPMPQPAAAEPKPDAAPTRPIPITYRAETPATALYDAFLEAMGRPAVPPSFKFKQMAAANRLAKDGMTPADAAALTAYLRSQAWRDAPIDMATLEREYGRWVAKGRPKPNRGAVTMADRRVSL